MSFSDSFAFWGKQDRAKMLPNAVFCSTWTPRSVRHDQKQKSALAICNKHITNLDLATLQRIPNWTGLCAKSSNLHSAPSRVWRSGTTPAPTKKRAPRMQVQMSAERKRGQRKEKTSKIVKNISSLFDILAQGKKRPKIVKKCQKVFRHFDNFRVAPVFQPLLGSPENVKIFHVGSHQF